MKILIIFIFTLALLSCDNEKDFKSDFEKHKFDQTVIDNLPRYDTLRKIVLDNYDSFNLNDTNYRFTYFYNFDSLVQISGYSNYDVPQKIYQTTVELFNEIGKEYIFGFTISKDSLFEIFVRNTHLTNYYLDVRERLYWYPRVNKIYKPEYPIKDTLLTDKWQYQIWYDKKSEF